LLTPDGVIFISIDDNEQANLKLICDTVFGEENFLANVVWQRTYAPISMKKYFSESHEYLYVYTKEKDKFNLNLLPRTEKQNNDYKNPDNDPRGVWKGGNLTVGPAVEKQIYEIIGPTGKSFYPPKGYCWRFTKERFEELRKDDRIWFGADGNNSPLPKLFLTEVQDGVTPMTLWTFQEVGHNQESTRELRDLFDNAVFTNPKPTRYIERILGLGSNPNDIIVDFFSGSGTTAHSILNLNSKDGGNRKFIMVQISEPSKIDSEAEKAGFKTLDQIGIERIKRAAAKIKSETNADIDYGFKHYTLVEPSEDTIDKLEEFKDTELFANNDTLSLFGKETVLETWLVKDGYGFGAKVEEVKLSGYTAYLCGKHLYFIEAGINENDMVALLDRYQQEPSFSPENIVVFGYSFNFSQTEMLRKNLFVLRDTHKNLKANFDIRY
ncbi:MAG TPA: site-specific DNA-methyltransferase, partial [Paludibacteraceae bacterium]|nr:site-specific DNA-methyltransferase [Paludibacteraceae bacterium]